ncbi:MAG: ATP-binding protein [Actinomycetaceae bacterium]|nr:ATP-binding protein [Actinomycetaceae bacterium]
MATNLVRRNALGLAEEILNDTPVLSVSGARQVGKSTLVAMLLKDRPSKLVNLDVSNALSSAKADPDGFVRQFPDGTLAIDEIQRAPELFRALKGALEEDRRPGRFVITGSSNLLNLKGAEESLAGRAETLHLRGLSRGERAQRREDFARFVWNLQDSEVPDISYIEDVSRGEYLEMLTRVSFPEVADATERRRDRWVDAYVERVLTKDASALFGVQYPDRLSALTRTLAAMGTSEFVAAKFANRLDVPARSLPGYLDALRSVFLIDALPAWGTNLGKRAISKPKVFLSDPGVAASLTGVDAPSLEDQIASVFTGGLLESFVATELLKQHTWSDVSFRLFHFRTSTGKEVDLVLENRRREIVGIEVKASTSIGARDFNGLKALKDIAAEKFHAGIVLYTGRDVLPMGERLWAMPISTLWNV